MFLHLMADQERNITIAKELAAELAVGTITHVTIENERQNENHPDC